MNSQMNLRGFAEVIKNLDALYGEIVRKTIQGGVRCQILLLREAHKITPYDTGTLDGSYESPPPRVDGDSVESRVENHCDYSLHVHEAPPGRKWNKEGTGPKFIAIPLFGNTAKFRELFIRAQRSG